MKKVSSNINQGIPLPENIYKADSQWAKAICFYKDLTI